MVCFLACKSHTLRMIHGIQMWKNDSNGKREEKYWREKGDKKREVRKNLMFWVTILTNKLHFTLWGGIVWTFLNRSWMMAKMKQWGVTIPYGIRKFWKGCCWSLVQLAWSLHFHIHVHLPMWWLSFILLFYGQDISAHLDPSFRSTLLDLISHKCNSF